MKGEQNICIKCAMCCDGTMFPKAIIYPEEIINSNYDFNIVRNIKRGFQLPCSYLSDKKCTIYQNRPYAICDKYKCKMLIDFNAGKISYKQAIKKIEDLLKIREQIIYAIDGFYKENTQLPLNKIIKTFINHYMKVMGELEFRKKYGQTMLDFKVLRMSLKRWFIKEKE